MIEKVTNRELWFKNKRWGYGWSPNTAKGWTVTLIYLAIILSLAKLFSLQGNNLNLAYSLSIGVLVIISTAVLFFTAMHHAPKPKWQWNDK